MGNCHLCVVGVMLPICLKGIWIYSILFLRNKIFVTVMTKMFPYTMREEWKGSWTWHLSDVIFYFLTVNGCLWRGWVERELKHFIPFNINIWAQFSQIKAYRIHWGHHGGFTIVRYRQAILYLHSYPFDTGLHKLPLKAIELFPIKSDLTLV